MLRLYSFFDVSESPLIGGILFRQTPERSCPLIYQDTVSARDYPDMTVG